jgi:hypothetical protein
MFRALVLSLFVSIFALVSGSCNSERKMYFPNGKAITVRAYIISRHLPSSLFRASRMNPRVSARYKQARVAQWMRTRAPERVRRDIRRQGCVKVPEV